MIRKKRFNEKIIKISKNTLFLRRRNLQKQSRKQMFRKIKKVNKIILLGNKFNLINQSFNYKYKIQKVNKIILIENKINLIYQSFNNKIILIENKINLIYQSFNYKFNRIVNRQNFNRILNRQNFKTIFHFKIEKIIY